MNYLTDTQRDIVEKLRLRYSKVHPVLFQRILEKSINETELFDILDTIPDSFPLIFDNDTRRLMPTSLILNN